MSGFVSCTHYIYNEMVHLKRTQLIHHVHCTATNTPNPYSSQHTPSNVNLYYCGLFFDGQMAKSLSDNFILLFFIKQAFILILYFCDSNYANRITVFFRFDRFNVDFHRI